jgi:hypothetical protein
MIYKPLSPLSLVGSITALQSSSALSPPDLDASCHPRVMKSSSGKPVTLDKHFSEKITIIMLYAILQTTVFLIISVLFYTVHRTAAAEFCESVANENPFLKAHSSYILSTCCV